jgi:hypothetical protein
MVGHRRPAPRTLLAPGFGSALLMVAALVVLALIGVALRAAFVAQFAPVGAGS